MCPTLQIVAADATRDQRLFDPLMTRLEELTPGIQLIRPGLAAIRARGPTRYYGGEMAAATGLIDTLRAAGVAGVRIGVADGVFTAEQAAYGDAGREGGKLVSPSEVKETPDSRREEHGDAGRGRGRPADSSAVTIVPAGGSAEFLASLPVSRLRDDDVARLLVHLGIRTLGDFARLDRGSVRDRFGDYGARLHALARGDDTRPVSARVPPVDLARDIEFETPFDQAEPVVFSVRRTAEDFISGLSADHLVCTELRVILTSERGEAYERVWLHPTAFSTASVIDRVRWQLAGSSSPLTSGVVKVRFEPVAVDAAYRHEPGLFGSGTDERVHHTLSRLQAMLGYDGVVTATIGGGRWLTERQVLVPWGERVVTPQPVNRPWPGQLPPPLPTVVFSFPRPVSVLAATGALVSVDERGNLSSAPWMMVDGHDAASVNQSQSRAAGAMNRTTGTAGAVGVAGVGRTTSGPTSAAGVGRTVGAATKIAAVSVAGGSSGAGATTRRDAVSVVRDGSVAGATDADHSFKIAAWAGPWPIDERMWDATRQRHACRFQAVDTEQRAWLLVLDEGGSWWIEGAYD
jgi:protein ImuB